MFLGARSRWTMPLACKAETASQTSRTMRAAPAASNPPPRSTSSSNVEPETCSYTTAYQSGVSYVASRRGSLGQAHSGRIDHASRWAKFRRHLLPDERPRAVQGNELGHPPALEPAASPRGTRHRCSSNAARNVHLKHENRSCEPPPRQRFATHRHAPRTGSSRQDAITRHRIPHAKDPP